VLKVRQKVYKPYVIIYVSLCDWSLQWRRTIFLVPKTGAGETVDDLKKQLGMAVFSVGYELRPMKKLMISI
jgi:hypothetical protein